MIIITSYCAVVGCSLLDNNTVVHIPSVKYCTPWYIQSTKARGYSQQQISQRSQKDTMVLSIHGHISNVAQVFDGHDIAARKDYTMKSGILPPSILDNDPSTQYFDKVA